MLQHIICILNNYNYYIQTVYNQFPVTLFYDVTVGCIVGGDGVKVAAMSSLAVVVLITGIKGAGLAPAVISVMRGVAVAVIVTAELPAGTGGDSGLLAGVKGTRGCGNPPTTGVPWTWGENDGIEGGEPPGATTGGPTGYVPAAAGGAAGKLVLKGFIAGGAAVELRFNDTIPDSRPG